MKCGGQSDDDAIPTSGTQSNTKTVFVATISVAIGIVPLFLLGIIAPTATSELGLTPSRLGAITAAFFLSSAAASVPAGIVADRFGPHGPLALVVLCTPVVLAFGSALSIHWYHLLFTFIALGITNSLAQPSANVLLASELRGQNMGGAMGIKAAASPFASILAGVIGPLAGTAAGWRWVLGVPCFALAGISQSLGTFSKKQQYAGESSTTPMRSRGLLAVASLLGAASSSTLSPFLAVSIVDSGLSVEFAGLCLIVGGVATVSARLVLGTLVDRTRVRPLLVVVVALIVGAGGMAGMAIAESPMAWLASVILAFGAGWGWPGALHTAIASAGSPGRSTGLLQAGTYVGGFAGGLAFGFVAEIFAFPLAWLMSGILSVMAAAAFYVASRLSI